ncbi:sigma-70 family RNA polymerase sigma factor [Pricia sp. S334]|uniref:Sigma-70 family RNA polymerase sigma factor n=1 Tax=Pricia mediterranea TaxID=3076079 RepID=A0ABU3L531_9FLAO|nr:sigma-70 family RNA polymerase sigma factor [Pricia sp. S334]MDT7828368.1 sigma-70 family RNA polymerase sigma factor [Pricia sp. S334]
MDSNCAKVSKLWTKIQKGNKKALSDLYGMYADVLYQFGKSCSSDSGLVEDAIHDLFLELYIRRKKLPVARNVKNYLFTILKRKIAALSKNRPLVISSEEDPNGKIFRNQELSKETEIMANEEKEELGFLLSNAIDKLTPKQKRGVLMRFYQNSTYEKMALDLGVSIGTARTLIYRSMQNMRRNLS